MNNIKRIHNKETITRRLELGYSLNYLEKEVFSYPDLLDAVRKYIDKISMHKVKTDSLLFCLNHLPDSYEIKDVMEIIVYGEITYEQLPENLKLSTNLAFMAGYHAPEQIKHRQDILSDKEYAHELLVKDASIYNYLPEHFKNDKDFLLNAIRKNSQIFLSINDDFRKERSFAEAALCTHMLSKECLASIYQLLSDELKNDKNLIIKSIKNNNYLYKILPEDLKKDINISKTAIKSSSFNLEFAPIDIKNNKEICYLACSVNINNFSFVGEKLKNDPAFICSIISYNPYIIKNLPTHIKDNKQVAMAAFKQDVFFSTENEDVFLYFSENIRNDKSIAYKAIDMSALSAKYLGKNLKNSVEFFEEYTNQKKFNINVFAYVPKTIKKEKKFLLKFIKQDIDCAHYIPDKLLYDISFIDSMIDIIREKYELNEQRNHFRYLLSILNFNEKHTEPLFYFLQKTMENEYKEDPESFNANIYYCLSDYYKSFMKNEKIDIYDYLNKHQLSKKLNEQLKNDAKNNSPKMKL